MKFSGLLTGIAVTGVVVLIIWVLTRFFGLGKRSTLRSLEGTDTGDPIADADSRMAHGMYEDAARVLLRSLAEQPGRSDLKMKLLEAYLIWDNKAEFLATAQQFQSDLHTSGDWNKVVTMGKVICPEDALFVSDA